MNKTNVMKKNDFIIEIIIHYFKTFCKTTCLAIFVYNSTVFYKSLHRQWNSDDFLVIV